MAVVAVPCGVAVASPSWSVSPVQSTGVPPSSAQVKTTECWLTVNSNSGLVSFDGFDGFSVSVGAGGAWVSIVNVAVVYLVDGVVLPNPSVALHVERVAPVGRRT